jgi:hypothetical protein
MALPDLSRLRVSESDADAPSVADESPPICPPPPATLPVAPARGRVRAALAEWHGLCGSPTLPPFPTWGPTKYKTEYRHTVNMSENDRYSAGGYHTPYEDLDVDVVEKLRTWSIEHVLPRSMVNGSEPGLAEADYFGWDVATRAANSRRGNLPLVLWPNDLPKNKIVTILTRARRGAHYEPHYNPSNDHRARLARRWLYTRATYRGVDNIRPPSVAQRAHADETIELVRDASMSYAENRLHLLLVQHTFDEHGVRWQNPLCAHGIRFGGADRRDVDRVEHLNKALALARLLAF